MAVDKSYARLGLFLVIGLVVMLATALLFIQRLRSREVIPMVTFISENVSGLDVSSPVRFRGVPLGRVTDLRVDPRGSGETIEVDFEVFLDRLRTVGADVANVRELADRDVFPGMRARVVGNPVTGEAYLLLDVPDNAPPPPPAPFPSDRTYVASMPSPLAAVQDRLPAVLERAEATLQVLREIITKMPDTLDRSNQFFTNVERIIRESELPALSADSRKFFSTTSAQIDEIAANLDGLVGEDGTLVKFAEEARAAIQAADMPESGRSTREAMERTSLAADDLRRSLPAMRESLDELRELARQLQDQPESVVYGPRPAGVKPK
jgi:paraquat-inducible protein B